MASPRNQHCASCIGTLSFPIYRSSCELTSVIIIIIINIIKPGCWITKDPVWVKSRALARALYREAQNCHFTFFYPIVFCIIA